MDITKEFVINKAIEYCKSNKLSVDKLSTQRIYKINHSFLFAQAMPPVEPGAGLTKDLETQPKATLIYHIEIGEFEETEYTEIYLT